MDWYPQADDQPRWGNAMAERLLDESLQVANMSGQAIQAIRPPLPQVEPFRARLGYPLKAERQLRIEDVIDVNRIYSDPRINWTGSPAGYSGSSRDALGTT